MIVPININTLSQKLLKQISGRGVEILKEKAVLIIAKVHKEAKDWKITIRKKLTKPSISRGFTRGHLNPHNSRSMNDSFPMRMSGTLKDALKYRVTQRTNKNSVTISVSRWFEATINRGTDYGEVLNTKHSLLRGYKERTYAMLDSRLRKIR